MIKMSYHTGVTDSPERLVVSSAISPDDFKLNPFILSDRKPTKEGGYSQKYREWRCCGQLADAKGCWTDKVPILYNFAPALRSGNRSVPWMDDIQKGTAWRDYRYYEKRHQQIQELKRSIDMDQFISDRVQWNGEYIDTIIILYRLEYDYNLPQDPQFVEPKTMEDWIDFVKKELFLLFNLAKTKKMINKIKTIQDNINNLLTSKASKSIIEAVFTEWKDYLSTLRNPTTLQKSYEATYQKYQKLLAILPEKIVVPTLPLILTKEEHLKTQLNSIKNYVVKRSGNPTEIESKFRIWKQKLGELKTLKVDITQMEVDYINILKEWDEEIISKIISVIKNPSTDKKVVEKFFEKWKQRLERSKLSMDDYNSLLSTFQTVTPPMSPRTPPTVVSPGTPNLPGPPKKAYSVTPPKVVSPKTPTVAPTPVVIPTTLTLPWDADKAAILSIISAASTKSTYTELKGYKIAVISFFKSWIEKYQKSQDLIDLGNIAESKFNDIIKKKISDGSNIIESIAMISTLLELEAIKLDIDRYFTDFIIFEDVKDDYDTQYARYIQLYDAKLKELTPTPLTDINALKQSIIDNMGKIETIVQSGKLNDLKSIILKQFDEWKSIEGETLEYQAKFTQFNELIEITKKKINAKAFLGRKISEIAEDMKLIETYWTNKNNSSAYQQDDEISKKINSINKYMIDKNVKFADLIDEQEQILLSVNVFRKKIVGTFINVSSDSIYDTYNEKYKYLSLKRVKEDYDILVEARQLQIPDGLKIFVADQLQWINKIVNSQDNFDDIIKNVKNALDTIKQEITLWKGNEYDYLKNHPNRNRAQEDRWKMLNAKQILLPYNNTIGLKWYKDSCWIDSVLVALFAKPQNNALVDRILAMETNDIDVDETENNCKKLDYYNALIHDINCVRSGLPQKSALMPMWASCIPKELRLNQGFNDFIKFIIGINQVFGLGININVTDPNINIGNMAIGSYIFDTFDTYTGFKKIGIERVASIYSRNGNHFITILDIENEQSLFVNVKSFNDGTAEEHKNLTLVVKINPRDEKGDFKLTDLDNDSQIKERADLPVDIVYTLVGRLYQKKRDVQLAGKIIPSTVFQDPQRMAGLQYALKNWDNIGKRIAGLSRAQL
jgi:hypothetical protein